MKGNFIIGLDLGSTWCKGVIIDNKKNVIATSLEKTGYSFIETAGNILADLFKKSGVTKDKIKKIVATGYGRKSIKIADIVKTEIMCHAKGAYHFFPDAMILIDIGGQDNKIVHVGKNGEIINFKLNRKCAAGTGAFIEESLSRLQVSFENVSKLIEESDKDITIASFCTVFAQTEIIKLIKENEKLPNIIKGIFNSVATRIIEMETLHGTVVLTGGVIAYYPFFKEILEKKANCEVKVPLYPQFSGAIGAALFGINSLTA